MAKTREDYKREQEEQALRDLSDLRYQGGQFDTTFNPVRIDEMTARPALDRDPRDQRSRADTYLQPGRDSGMNNHIRGDVRA